MCAYFKVISILTCISLSLVSVKAKAKAKHGPGGMSFNDSISCDEFARYARFNPYSVLYQKWFVFFYWAPPRPRETLIFSFPTANHTKHLRKIFDGNTILPVNWTARQILMEDQRNDISLLIERGDRGQYWLYPVIRIRGQKLKPRDIRLKQTGDNRILGMMDCDDYTVLAMSRIGEVPPKNRLLEEASRLGYRSRRGKSYLYQGHEWMPIPEDDERIYWKSNQRHKGWEKASNQAESSEQSRQEEEPKPTHEPGKSQTDKKALELQLSNDQENPKSSSTEVKPESKTDQVHRDINNEPRNLKLTKEQLDSQETNVRETIQSTDEPNSSTSNNELEKIMVVEPDNTQMTNELEKHQATNEPEKVQKKGEPGNLQSIKENEQEDPHLTKELNTPECNDCNELVYIKSTDEPYIPESTQSSNNRKNKWLGNEPVTAQISKESVRPHSSNKRDLGAQAYSEPSASPEPPSEPVNSQFGN